MAFDPSVKLVTSNGGSTVCPDAQHLVGGIAQPAEQRPVPRAVAALAAMGIRPTRRLTTLRGAVGAAGADAAAAAVPAVLPGRAGREQVRQWFTRLRR